MTCETVVAVFHAGSSSHRMEQGSVRARRKTALLAVAARPRPRNGARFRPAVHPGSRAQKATMPAAHAALSLTYTVTARSIDPHPSGHHVPAELGPITEFHVRYPILLASSVYSLVPLHYSKHLFDCLFVILSPFQSIRNSTITK